MASASDAFFSLNNDTRLPTVGYSTYGLSEEEVMKNMDVALGAGYRLFDTAHNYNNEASVGKALQKYMPKYGLSREDLFITGNLSQTEMYASKIVKKSYRNSVLSLGIDYFDLFVIQLPASHHFSKNSDKSEILTNMAWSTLTELYDAGNVNAIGVSNFQKKDLEFLLKKNFYSLPAVNQVEWHVGYHDDELLKFCRLYNIQLQGYSAFGRLKHGPSYTNNNLVINLAKNNNLSPDQLLTTWSVQTDVATLVTSTDPDVIKNNVKCVKKVSKNDINVLNNIFNKNKNPLSWNPYPFN